MGGENFLICDDINSFIQLLDKKTKWIMSSD